MCAYDGGDMRMQYRVHVVAYERIRALARVCLCVCDGVCV